MREIKIFRFIYLLWVLCRSLQTFTSGSIPHAMDTALPHTFRILRHIITLIPTNLNPLIGWLTKFTYKFTDILWCVLVASSKTLDLLLLHRLSHHPFIILIRVVSLSEWGILMIW